MAGSVELLLYERSPCVVDSTEPAGVPSMGKEALAMGILS